ncbi:hypothetical protein HELRODRAFT_168760 [Helobdella robusta]|uniref:Uncharacterized protein n=1 Tax=Helobdella robusta TaxID=6412 RepID=T1F0X7_HELRO|nr:hypothetical protein HELRODRAFT_168760 [Helobdella robusta]ESO08848.1 hypothetical protein HELRODRAFT_168760 [Helobdella robusta]
MFQSNKILFPPSASPFHDSITSHGNTISNNANTNNTATIKFLQSTPSGIQEYFIHHPVAVDKGPDVVNENFLQNCVNSTLSQLQHEEQQFIQQLNSHNYTRPDILNCDRNDRNGVVNVCNNVNNNFFQFHRGSIGNQGIRNNVVDPNSLARMLSQMNAKRKSDDPDSPVPCKVRVNEEKMSACMNDLNLNNKNNNNFCNNNNNNNDNNISYYNNNNSNNNNYYDYSDMGESDFSNNINNNNNCYKSNNNNCSGGNSSSGSDFESAWFAMEEVNRIRNLSEEAAAKGARLEFLSDMKLDFKKNDILPKAVVDEIVKPGLQLVLWKAPGSDVFNEIKGYLENSKTENNAKTSANEKRNGEENIDGGAGGKKFLASKGVTNDYSFDIDLDDIDYDLNPNDTKSAFRGFICPSDVPLPDEVDFDSIEDMIVS